ncbi:MAG: low molecular weight phosphotyrosine protein phosphatase [Gammaproteobacteria bacterium]|nr:low molecular weight phosphotyrosine protein phosphatase [Gammaproteobacteria bacterium]
MTRVLFVCMGNICRSPTAEAVVREYARREAVLTVEVDSAGTHGYHRGDPPDERSIIAARRRGYDLTALRARVVEVTDFERFDLVLAMDTAVLERLRALVPSRHAARVKLFLEFAPALGRRDVPDPYYGGAAGFEEVLDLVEEGARGLLAALAR